MRAFHLLRLGLAIAVWVGLHGACAAASFDAASLIEGWLLPRYDALVAASIAQRGAWQAFCTVPDKAAVPVLQDHFTKTADAWSAVEFVTMGPISQSLRADRFNFFPDRRNAVSRAIAELLGADAARLQPGQFPQASAAAQGLPALERLLFDQGAPEALLQSGAEATQRCALGGAIATNLAAIATEVRTAWGDRTNGLLSLIVAGKGDPALFPDVNVLPGMILTDLAGAYQRAIDTRILPVLGSRPSDAKPLLAEGYRSGRSGRVVTVMIGSADALLQRVAMQLPSRPQSVVVKAATNADAAAASFPSDLGAAAQTDAGAARIQAAIKIFKVTQRSVYRPVASYFGISLGFNALDGD